MKKVYKVQKLIQGWGFATVGHTPLKEQAENAVKLLISNGHIARFVEEQY